MKQATTWTVSLVLLGLLIGGLYWWQLEQRTGPPNPPSPPAAAAPAQAPPQASASASAIRYPIEVAAPVASSAEAAAAKAPSTLADALAEVLGERAVLQWLNVDSFAHRVAVTVDNLARPHAPAHFWPVHPTPGRFATGPAGVVQAIASVNSTRYSAFVAWVDTLDVGQVAALYRRLYPQFQRAYENLGYPGRYFNDRVIAVIDHLIETPEVAEPVEVNLAHVRGPIQPARPWVMVEFSDPELEERSSGQKLMLRIGSANAYRIKAKLMELRAALTQPR